MYLLDTNIILEALLDQEKSQDVREFFESTNLSETAITDLSLHSIGIILFRFNQYSLFISFLDDMIEDGLTVLSLPKENYKNLPTISQKHHLDFDDAYQYATIEEFDLQLISFDKDFDTTERGRKEPREIITEDTQ